MRRLNVTVLDLVAKGPSRRLFARVMNPNLASIMPQAIAAWCEELGHKVHFFCYTGFEDLGRELEHDTDLLFIGAFTRSAQAAYAISNLYRRRGAVTVLGGPHARSYPEDAARYFDYVLGLTDRAVIEQVVNDCARNRPEGVRLGAARQPRELPTLEQRWKFVESAIAKAPFFRVVPQVASMGCPYTCNFCIDSVIPFEELPSGQIKADLRFLQSRMRRPVVGWHDPNFGVRFDSLLDAIEETVPPGRVRFIAESSLSLLSEPRLRRLRRNGFVGLLPGIESWFTLGGKSKTGSANGMEKVTRVAEHVNLILRYVPYVQTNFVLGLDCDEGPAPFDLTKRFLDLVPGAYPAFSLLTSYGAAAPLNLELQRQGRVLPWPHHFLDSNHAMNVRPKNYGWAEFYDHAIDLAAHGLTGRRVWRRLWATPALVPSVLNAIRALSSNRTKYQRQVRALLDSDPAVRRFFDGESTVLPRYFEQRMRRQLGFLWDALPPGAVMHDQNAYLKSQAAVLAAP